MAFYFSSITTQLKPKTRKKGKENEEEEDPDEDDEPSSQVVSEQWMATNQNLVEKGYLPAIGYWIALTTPNGAPTNPLQIHRALLECGVATTANQVLPLIYGLFVVLFLF